MDFERIRRTAITRRDTLRPRLERAEVREEFWNKILFYTTLFIFCFFIFLCLLYLLSLYAGYAGYADNQDPDWLISILVVMFLVVVFQSRANEDARNLRMIYQKLSLAELEVRKLERIIINNAEFVLYLRDFESGMRETPIPDRGCSASGIANPLMWSRNFGSETMLAVVTCIQKFIPVVLLSNSADKTPLMDGLVVYSDEVNWEDDFRVMADRAKYVVIDTRDHLSFCTNGLKKELKYLSMLSSRNLILIGYKNDLDALIFKYPFVHDCSVLTCTFAEHSYYEREVKLDKEPINLDALEKFLRTESCAKDRH